MEANSPNEKQGNIWKNKLEDVPSLPQEALNNKDAAWERLYVRLAEKPRDKKLVWYWLAAASALTAIIISLFTIPQTTTGIAQGNKNIPADVKKPIAKDEPIKNILPGITTTETKVRLQKNGVVKKEERKPATVDAQAATQPAINDQQNSGNQTTIILPASDTNAIATISSPPVQKKLKVVHVNELGEVAEFPADVAHGSDLHLFQLKLAQQEIYNASSIASNNSSFGRFRQKKND